MSIQQLFHFIFQQGQMPHYNSPHNIVGNAVISMNYIISRIYNPARRCNIDVRSNPQQSVHSLPYYSYISFDCSTQTYIRQVYVIPSWTSLKKRINL